MSELNNLNACRDGLEQAVSAVAETLEGASDELDLMALSERLHEAHDLLGVLIAPVEEMQAEIAVLKADLIGRVLSMTRAIHVALDKDGVEDEALLQNQVTEASAKDLLHIYRQACVRFRDTFPGNTRYLNAASAPLKDWSDFKIV